MYVIYDKVKKKVISKPSTALALTPLAKRLKEQDKERYELKPVKDSKDKRKI